MRRHHRYNLRSTAADSSDSSDEEEKDAGCPGCRRTAPYYATKLLSPDADGKDREALVQKLRSSPFFQGVITREHPFYPKIGANTPPPWRHFDFRHLPAVDGELPLAPLFYSNQP